MWPNATIYGFEADPCNYNYSVELTKNISNIKVYNTAIFNEDKTINFYRYANIEEISNESLAHGQNYQDTGVGSVLLPGDLMKNLFNYNRVYETIKVKCTKIKTFCLENNIPSIDMLFMDIQGGEYNAFLGMEDLLQTLNATVFEFSTNRLLYDGETDVNEISKLLNNNGLYEIERMWQINNLTGDIAFAR